MNEIGTPLTPVARRALLCGSGELGKEVAIELQRYGVEVIAVDRYANAPAMQVAHRSHVINMLDAKALREVIVAEQPSHIIPEVEAIATPALVELENEGYHVTPTAKAALLTMNREGIRRLAAETLGLPTSPYIFADNYEDFCKAVREIGLPCVVKPVMSSSGHGQSTVKKFEDLKTAFDAAMEGARGDVKEVIIEEFIHFTSEFTLLTVTQKNGPTLFCPPIGHVQAGGDYRESWQPYQISEKDLKDAQMMAEKVTASLTGYGIWGVEFFLTDTGVVFSELSPRPHDTGMVTLGHTTNLSEFELHLRAVLGLPIHDIRLEHAGCSAVILADKDYHEAPEYNLMDALKEECTRVRIFGKPEAHFGRRMGVVLCYGEKDADTNALRDKAKRLAKTVLGTDPYMEK